MNNAVFPHPSPVMMHDMDSMKRTWQKLSGFLRDALESLDTVNLARKEGTMLGRLDGMLRGAQREAEIRLEHSPLLPYDRNLEASISIITAEPLSSDVRFRINRMFSAEFPRFSIRFRAESQNSKPQPSNSLPRCAR